MGEVFGTAIYAKNIPIAERVARVVGALGAGAAAALFLSEPWARWAAAGSGLMLAVTGLFGFCPACYLVGRKLGKPGAT